MASKRELRELANSLPELIYTNEIGGQRMVQRTVIGQSLLNKGVTEIAPSKENGYKTISIKARKYYTTMVPDVVDHYKNLLEMRKHGGDEAIALYVAKVHGEAQKKTLITNE